MITNEELIKLIEKDLSLGLKSITSVLELSKEGATVPFIARYRKDRTGNLDEVAIRDVIEKHEFYVELDKRKDFILKSIDSQKQLTPELKKNIESLWDKTKIEDLYLPFKPKKKTKGERAKEMGLEPFAQLIYSQNVLEGDPHLEASRYISEEKGVKNLNDVYQGVIFILGEKISDNPELRQKIREVYWRQGQISSAKSPKFNEKNSKFDTYFEYKEKISVLATEKGAHRYLAITRGENENVLTISVLLNEPEILDLIKKYIIKNEKTIFNNILEEASSDSFNRLIKPSMTNEVRARLKSMADDFSIKVFAKNLKTILLASPFGGQRLLAIDPAFNTGCKIVALSETGEFVENAVIYPNKPQCEIEKSESVLFDFVKKHGPKAIVIGNGTASRETEAFVRNFITKNKSLKIISAVVSESGASIYSASNIAREEFPSLDLTVRGAICIGRRFQDPLAELVKIDSKSVGVGQYQHDVNKVKLKTSLEAVVSDCVNLVGVDLNTASPELLSYVSGIGPSLAQNIIEFRKKKKFTNRDELRKVSRFSDKVFEQAVGFLRINDGENVLDNTGIHPETYKIVESISRKTGKNFAELVGNIGILSTLHPNDFVTDDFGPLTVRDIIEDLKKPGRDPRKKFEIIEFAEGINEICDLKENMILNGVVTNVTNFGAFVDVGVHTDGLVHTSEIANRFVSDPSEVVSVGDKVKVKVLGVDMGKKQISLSIRAAFIKEESREKKQIKTDPIKAVVRQKPKIEPRAKIDSRPSDIKKQFSPDKRKPDFNKQKKGAEKPKALTSNPFADLAKLIKN